MADQSPPSSPRPAGSPPHDSSSAVSVGSNAGGTHCENRKRKMEEEDTGNTPDSQALIPYPLNLKNGEESENPNPNSSPPPTHVVGDNKRRLVDEPNPNPPANPFKCNFCHRGFSSPQALGGHQNAHKQDRAFVQQWQRLLNPSSDQFGYVNIPMYDRYYNMVSRAYPALGSAYGGMGTPAYGRPMMGQGVYGQPPIQWGALGATNIPGALEATNNPGALGAINNPGLRPGTPRPLALPYYAPNDGRRMGAMLTIEQGHVGTSSPASSGGAGGGNEVQIRDLLRIEEEKKELDLSLKL